MTIADGRVNDPNYGGGIYNIGTLTVTHSTLSGNSAPRGGGIWNTGTLTVSDSTVSGNSAGDDGGGIYSAGFGGSLINCTIANNHATFDGGGLAGSGRLTVTGCILSGNSTAVGLGGGGGAISNGGSETLTVRDSTFLGSLSEQGGAILNISGTLVVSGSSFSQNHAGAGGGIRNVFGTGTVTNSTFSGNFGGAISNAANSTLTIAGCSLTGNPAGTMEIPAVGGGISNSGTLTITNSTLSGNSATIDGGGIENDGTLTVTGTTLSGNVANLGGGISNFGTLTVTNSTLSGNIASFDGGGIMNFNPGTVTLTSSTLSGNSANGTMFGDGGGGIHSYGGLHSSNSIMAGNNATVGAPDLAGDLGSQGYNLIGNTQGGSGFVDTDLFNVDPHLGPLQDNGGPTQTMALLAGSPALNAGDPAQLGVPDQRGVVRSGGVNIGAYQASASAFVLTAPATVTAGTPFDATLKAVDPFGQTALGYTGRVTFISADPYGATLPADYTFTAADHGVHLFPGGATLYTAGSWDVTATDTSTGSITGSASVSVNPAAADHLLFLQQPTDTPAGQTINPVIVEVVDAFGNVETSDNSDTITLSIGANPSGGTLSGTLTLSVVNGVATFSDLSIDLAGAGYTLHATVGGSLGDIDSDAFSIT
jgi:hypothetical protein